MTIIEATSKLFTFLKTQDSIFLPFLAPKNKKDDFSKIMGIFDPETEEKDRECLILALEELEKTFILKKTKDKNLWFLQRPIEAYEQSVTLDYQTIISISAIINKFCDTIGDSADKCDPSNIQLKDIKNILAIAIHLAEKSLKTPPSEESQNNSFDNN